MTEVFTVIGWLLMNGSVPVLVPPFIDEQHCQMFLKQQGFDNKNQVYDYDTHNGFEDQTYDIHRETKDEYSCIKAWKKND